MTRNYLNAVARCLLARIVQWFPIIAGCLASSSRRRRLAAAPGSGRHRPSSRAVTVNRRPAGCSIDKTLIYYRFLCRRVGLAAGLMDQHYQCGDGSGRHRADRQQHELDFDLLVHSALRPFFERQSAVKGSIGNAGCRSRPGSAHMAAKAVVPDKR